MEYLLFNYFVYFMSAMGRVPLGRGRVQIRRGRHHGGVIGNIPSSGGVSPEGNDIQDENGDYILDELGNFIQDEG